mmetsp:Transcript_86509/g.242233  ORF Transcript_86509/g.242233 Transcript_86509/m.242233 type:complete len:226 (+) Transcript_86509:2-679(+)
MPGPRRCGRHGPRWLLCPRPPAQPGFRAVGPTHGLGDVPGLVWGACLGSVWPAPGPWLATFDPYRRRATLADSPSLCGHNTGQAGRGRAGTGEKKSGGGRLGVGGRGEPPGRGRNRGPCLVPAANGLQAPSAARQSRWSRCSASLASQRQDSGLRLGALRVRRSERAETAAGGARLPRRPPGESGPDLEVLAESVRGIAHLRRRWRSSSSPRSGSIGAAVGGTLR